MRDIPEGLRALLAGGAATVCRCWLVTRTDGVALGFTDHDRALAFGGVAFEPGSGLNASARESQLGFARDTQEFGGAITSDRVTEADLDRGAYEGADVQTWVVDWTDPANRLMTGRGFVREVRRADAGFAAEVVGYTDRYATKVGRIYTRGCDRNLGDAKCRADLSGAAFTAGVTVAAVTGPLEVILSGAAGRPEGWFTGGRVLWTHGANAGAEAHVQAAVPAGALLRVTLWAAPAFEAAPGDAAELRAGCDKRFATCRDKFANGLNFRGFPHMPGDDWVTNYPSGEGGHDGGSLVAG